VGHLFQGRYHNVLVDKDAYLLELSRYLHLNPVRAGLVKLPEEYRWSSYRTYLSVTTPPAWLSIDYVLAQLNGKQGQPRRKYREFVMEGVRGEVQNPFKEVIAGIAIGRDNFWKEIKARFRWEISARFRTNHQGKEIPALKTIDRRTNIDEIVEKVGEIYNIPKEMITSRKRPTHSASQVALYLVRKKTDLSLNEIASYFGGRHYTAESVAYRRVEQRRQLDQRFDQELKRIEEEITSSGSCLMPRPGTQSDSGHVSCQDLDQKSTSNSI
jgi:hypothetical protein